MNCTSLRSRFVSARTIAATIALASLATARLAAQASTTPARLTLGDAARLAAHQSAPAEVARYRTAEAEARVRQSRAALLPDFTSYAQQSGRTFNAATFGFTFPTVPGQPPLFNPLGQIFGPVYELDLRAQLRQDLFDPAALQRVRAAGAEAQASAAEASSAGEQAAATAAQAYLRALHAEGVLGARTADSVLADSLLGIAREQLSAGVGVGLDVTRAQSQLAGVRAQLIAARNERDQAQLDLHRALGISLDAPLVLTDSLSVLSTPPPASEAEAVQTALRQRPDLRAADLQLRANEQQIAAIRAERLPTLALTGDGGDVSARGNQFQGLNHLLPTYTWGVQFSVPIFDGFRRDARVQEQRAMSNELLTKRHDLEQQATAEVRGALLNLASTREQVAASRERLQFAEQELSQARDRFRAGVAGNANVITASLSLNSSRTQLVDALTSYQSARVSLARAQGTTTSLP